jgi:ATP-binding cassette, subfamily B, bacterial MsbA
MRLTFFPLNTAIQAPVVISVDSKKTSLATDQALYLRLLSYLKPYKTRFIIGMLASIPAASLDGVLAYAVGPLTDRMLKDHDYSILMWIPALLLGATLVQGVCFYISNYCNYYIGTAISRDLRTKLFSQVIKMDLAYFKRFTTGELYSRYVSDPGTLQQAIVTNLQDFVIQLFSFLGLAAVLMYRNWIFAFVAIAVISTIVVPLQVISKRIRKLDHDSNQNLAQMISVFTEAMWSSKLIIGFQLEKYQSKRFERALKDYFNTSMRILKTGTWLKPLMQLIAAGGISGIVVIGAMQVQSGKMSPGDLGSFIVALVLLYKPVKTLGNIFGKVQRILAPAERVFEKLDARSALPEPENPISMDRVNSIEFKDVQFEYVLGKPVLQNINFTAQAGEIIALVGQSGGGKSTLVDLIPRFMDVTGGQIQINGVDIRQVSTDWLRSQIAIVSQDSMLIDGTIRENILLGRLDATEADILEAVQLAQLGELIESLPLGLETPTGKNGTLLSGGQRQRIAIARAFLRNAPLLILDEATSALDNESEALVQDALMSIMKGRTVFVIAHRLSTIQCANRIMVVDRGEIIETGDHQALIDLNGIYSKLYHLQFRFLEAREQERMAIPNKYR